MQGEGIELSERSWCPSDTFLEAIRRRPVINIESCLLPNRTTCRCGGDDAWPFLQVIVTACGSG